MFPLRFHVSFCNPFLRVVSVLVPDSMLQCNNTQALFHFKQTSLTYPQYSYVYERMLQGCSIYAPSCFCRCMKYISHIPLQGFRYFHSLPFQTHQQSGHCQTVTSGTSIHSLFKHTTNLATVRLQLNIQHKLYPLNCNFFSMFLLHGKKSYFTSIQNKQATFSC
jgi:hypothetical protein